MNTIEAAELTYPDKADANGGARRYYKRKAYYFGPHNSPESFSLFGEWKRQLIESGQAPDVKCVRKNLAHALGSPSTASHERRPHFWMGGTVVAATLLLMAANVVILATLKFGSTDSRASVDGIAISQYETNVIRGVRLGYQRDNRISDDSPALRIAEMMSKLPQRPRNGKLHNSEKGS